MSIKPSYGGELILKGKFRFRANVKNGLEIEDCYIIEISIPDTFPHALPKVKEIGGKIPRDGNHHVNSDQTLCLGSPLRLLKKNKCKPKSYWIC
jgi:hypothetical protein